MPKAIRFLQYEKCSTCRKAKKWLDAHDIPVVSRPIVDEPPTKAELAELWKRAGVPIGRLFNTSGLSYRALDRDALAKMSDDQKLALLAKDGKLVKRPVLDDGRHAFFGFDEAAWKKALLGG